MSALNPVCPRCQSTVVVKNGRIHNGRQNFKCKACGRQFVLNPTKKVIGQDTRKLIDKLLLEKLPLAGIARVTGVSEGWLQTYVNALVRCDSQASRCLVQKKGRLTIQCDVTCGLLSATKVTSNRSG
jgi:transposase-like protein